MWYFRAFVSATRPRRTASRTSRPTASLTFSNCTTVAMATPPRHLRATLCMHRSLLYKPADDVGAVLDDAVRFIDAARKSKGSTVLLACHTGVSRSPIVAAAYLIRSHGFSVKEALRIVLDARPLADPSLRLRMRLRELHPLARLRLEQHAARLTTPADIAADADSDDPAAASCRLHKTRICLCFVCTLNSLGFITNWNRINATCHSPARVCCAPTGS
jgi:hypothetical protein